MKKVTILSIFIFSLFTELALADAYYVRSQVGSPWGRTTYEEDMDAVFGIGGWINARYETVNAVDLFSSANDFIYMEGSDDNANELEAFIATNKVKMEDWVFAGGTLFINSAPNEGNGMDMGFNVNLIYSDSSGTSTAVDPNHPIFHGPFGVTGNTFTGNSFGHATVSGADLNPLIVDNNHGRFVLAEKTHGRGVVFFGGMTSRYYHNPKPQVTYLHRNIRMYQATIEGASLSYSRHLTMNPGDDSNIQITLNNRDDFLINADISYSSSSLVITGPASLSVDEEDSETITVNVATSPIDEGSHTVEVTLELDQGETLVAEIVIDIVNFEQLTPDTTFHSYTPDVSSDGNLIIFTSNADLATTGKPTSARDVFIYNQKTSSYKQLTSNAISKTCNNAVISGNGKFAAAFCNSSLDLNQLNADGSYELYYFDLTLNTVQQVNINSNFNMSHGVRPIAINHEGDFVYFANNSNLDPTISNADGSSEVFVFHSSKNEVRQLSNFNYSNTDVKSISVDYEGKRFVVVSRGNPIGENSRRYWRAFGGTLSKGITHQITKNNNTRHTEGVAISGNGEFVAIQSRDDLDPERNTNNRHHIFRAEFEGKNFKQITQYSGYYSYDPQMSNDGNRIVFISNASLAGPNNASNYEVFMYEHRENRLRAMTELNTTQNADAPTLSADGSTLVFQGNADWITGDNPSNNQQIFFQTNLGVGSVSKYEDPLEQYAQNFLQFSSVDDEEEIKKATGYFSWILVVFFSMLAMRRRKY